METSLEYYRHGDASAATTIEAWIDILGCTPVQLQSILDADAFVLGGGISNIKEVCTLLPQAMSRYLFPGLGPACIFPTIHGTPSGIRGAVLLLAERGMLTH